MSADQPFTGERLSFLDLFRHHLLVEIPLIQRDYAQGRASAGAVRDGFLDCLFRALEGEKELSLDFVYGTVKEGVFQPIDGQQRLTTLFLLHWFLARKCGLAGEFRRQLEDADGDCRFRYSVRPSSRRFFNRLLKDEGIDPAKKLSGQIRDQSWFFKSWLHDPSVKGALEMLNAIQRKWQDADGTTHHGRLRLITMEVLSLGGAISPDGIYLKMNARGKELTGFEKFKAWMVGRPKGIEWRGKEGAAPHWKILLDGAWLEFFWFFQQDRPKPAEDVSRGFYRIFAAYADHFHAMSGSAPAGAHVTNGEGSEILWNQVFTSKCLGRVFDLLDFLSTPDPRGKWVIQSIRENLKNHQAGLFSNGELGSSFFEEPGQTLTFESRCWLHVIDLFARYLIPRGGREEVQWFRVMRNLLSSTEITAENFSNTLNILEELARRTKDHEGCVLTFLSGNHGTPIEFQWQLKQLEDQLVEEMHKAHLIMSTDTGGTWERLIYEAENADLFAGQIELLLEGEGDEKRKVTPELFQERFRKMTTLTTLAGDKTLAARATLSRCEAIGLGWQQRITFPGTSGEWKVSLDRSRGDNKFRAGVTRLVDELRGRDGAEMEAEFQDIIGKDELLPSPWMRHITEHGDVLFGASETWKVQQYCDRGTFLYYKTNATDGDIMIGPVATLRNTMIERLVGDPASGWRFASEGEGWRRLVSAKDARVVFFKGHQIALRKERAEGVISCVFGYHALEIRGPGTPHDSPMRVDYPKTGGLEEIARALQEHAAREADEGIRAILHELALVCAPRGAHLTLQA